MCTMYIMESMGAVEITLLPPLAITHAVVRSTGEGLHLAIASMIERINTLTYIHCMDTRNTGRFL